VITLFDKNISGYLFLEPKWLYIAIFVSLSQFITLINLTLWIAEHTTQSYIVFIKSVKQF